MTAVTVELEDLETIVFATSVIKTIEGILNARKNDPFVRPHLDFTEAHDRLATAMRNATRAAAGTAVNFDAPLTKTEARTLRSMVDALSDRGDGIKLPWYRISGPDKAAPGQLMGEYDVLAAKGCIRIGQFVTGIVWPGAPAADIKADPERGFGAEITARGRTKLAEFEAGSKPSTVLGAG